jgi:hypothetical protein
LDFAAKTKAKWKSCEAHLTLPLNNGVYFCYKGEGVSYPKSYSFQDINNFIRDPDTQYEELQDVCLGLLNRINYLEKKLSYIRLEEEQ